MVCNTLNKLLAQQIPNTELFFIGNIMLLNLH